MRPSQRSALMRKLWCVDVGGAARERLSVGDTSRAGTSAPVDAGDAQSCRRRRSAGRRSAGAELPAKTSGRWSKSAAPTVTNRARSSFELTDYESVYAFRHPVAASVESGPMPPWQPAKGATTTMATTASPMQSVDPAGLGGSGAPRGTLRIMSRGAARGGLEPHRPTISMPVDYIRRQSPDDYRCL